mmetsp:Transcript_98514/g.175476  ORF Transcript_98514/g.175476 Transcript_98514/m.175476 type:complete len:107 (-) Transcript_98514:826-1146(-)
MPLAEDGLDAPGARPRGVLGRDPNPDGANLAASSKACRGFGALAKVKALTGPLPDGMDLPPPLWGLRFGGGARRPPTSCVLRLGFCPQLPQRVDSDREPTLAVDEE